MSKTIKEIQKFKGNNTFILSLQEQLNKGKTLSKKQIQIAIKILHTYSPVAKIIYGHKRLN